MCDINCIWLFNLLVAVVLILLQQQQHVDASKEGQQQHYQKNLKHITPYDGITTYAAAAAAKYLQRTSLPHQVLKREIKNDKKTDFISYMNDFNIQDETSMPEDIIDQQHLQQLIDEQQQQQPEEKLKEKYAGARTSGTSVPNIDVDIIDVNLPYDDSTDTDSDVDIILESQRSSERRNDNRTGNSTSKNKKYDSEENEMLLEEHKKNFQKTNNKKEMFNERKKLKNKSDNNCTVQKHQLIKHEKNIDYSSQYNSYGEGDDRDYKDPGDDADGNEYKMQLGEYSDNDDDDDEDDDDDGSAEYERFKSMHEQKNKELQEKQIEKEQKSTKTTTMNAGIFNGQYFNEKMFNNHDNDKIKHILDYTDDNNNKNKNLNDYEIFHKHLMEERQKLLQQEQQQQQQKEQRQSKQDAIGDIEDKEEPNDIKTTVSSSSNSDDKNKNLFASAFIPRKIKRHNGAARLDDATNRFTRLKQEEQQQQEFKSHTNMEENHPDAVAKVSSQEENFKKKYYDILKENSTSAADQHIQQTHHYHQASEDADPQDLSYYDDNNGKEASHDNKRQTAFEKEKSLRRNNKSYGHKNHKKKYKDYLRYSQIMMMTTSSRPPSMVEQNPTETTVSTAKDNHERIGLSEDDMADLGGLKDKHIKKLELEKIKSLIPPAPIFVLKTRKENGEVDETKMIGKTEKPTAKPFYEGQINYFLETPDDDSERANEVRFITKGERMGTNDWYRKLSPVLGNVNNKVAPPTGQRSGIGVGRSRGGYSPYHHYRPQHQGQVHHGKTRNHNYHQQHHHHHQQQLDRRAHHNQMSKHRRHHAYQRKGIPKRIVTTTTPMLSPSRKQQATVNGLGEMGHQITDIKDLDRYYAKWPHLARVQSQLHEEQMREQQSQNYPDYEYDNDEYFEENDHKDEDLPPYIRKFNRRNKQLLNLLEGTISPPTKSPQQLRWSGSKQQSGPRESNVGSMSVHIDDDYLKEKRKRYHQRQRQIHDLFSQQRPSTTTRSPPPYPFVNANANENEKTAMQLSHTDNHLPDEDVSISLESNEQENEFSSNSAKHAGDSDDDNDDTKVVESEIWQKEIESKSSNMAAGNSQIAKWQNIQTPTDTAAVATAKKSAIHKLPSYPSIAGGYMNRPKSRSSQFAPSSGSEYRRAPTPYLSNLNNNNDNMNNNKNNFNNAGGFVAYNKAPVVSKQINGRFSANMQNDYNKQQQQSVLNTTRSSPDAAKIQSISGTNYHLNPPSPSMASSSVTSSFIYHRVVDASPRLVGAGYTAGRKQRLPFVAITDRRLETSKKSLTDHEKDFEQNRYPLP